MYKRMLCDSLVDKLRYGLSSRRLIHAFNETYKYRSDDECIEYFHLFLFAATSHNHTELVKDLLADTCCNVKISLKFITRLLFVAICSGNRELVQIFLSTSTELKLLEGHFCICPSDRMAGGNEDTLLYVIRSRKIWRTSNDLFSAVDCACLCDERDILQLLVAYDRETIEKRHFSVPHECRIMPTPLHVVMILTRNECFNQLLPLPAITRIILDAGVDVNALDQYSSTALDILINKVCLYKDTHVTAEECIMMVDTARVLLNAGSFTTSHRKVSSLERLVSLTVVRTVCLSHMNGLQDLYYAMTSQIIKLLMQHGALNTQVSKTWLLETVLLSTIDILKKIIKCGLLHAEQGSVNACGQNTKTILDNVSDILRYLLLVEADVMNYLFCLDVASLQDIYNTTYFLVAFMLMFRGSSVCVRPNKLMRLMISGLDATQVNLLKIKLIQFSWQRDSAVDDDVVDDDDHDDDHDDDSFVDDNDKVNTYACKALEWVSAVVVPFSLGHLSRHAITRAMSYRCLDEEKVATLGLAKHLIEYIQLQTN